MSRFRVLLREQREVMASLFYNAMASAIAERVGFCMVQMTGFGAANAFAFPSDTKRRDLNIRGGVI